MERRKFLKNAGIGVGGFLFLPGIVSAGSSIATTAGQVIAIPENIGQIRHGLLQLPQFGVHKKTLSFDWLLDVSRNLFFKNGFGASSGTEDLEIVSVLLENPEKNWADAIQIQECRGKTVVLTGEQEFTFHHRQDVFALLENRQDAGINCAFGHFDQAGKHRFSFEGEREIFVYLLAGKLTVNGQLLQEHYGLGLKTKGSVQLEMLERSRFFILEKG